MTRVLFWLAILAAGYLVLVLALFVWQDAMVFPAAGRGDRGLGDVVGARQQALRRADGGQVRLVEVEAAGPLQAVCLCFVGNGEDLASAARTATVLADYGLSVVGVEHAGYGASDGPPTVATLLEGAELAAAHARRLATARGVPLVAFGTSLGTFCAVHCAARGLVDRIVLRAPPTSMLAAARARFWWLPVALLLRHRFDNLAIAAEVRVPALVLHGDRDRIVPLAQGETLCAAFAGPRTFVRSPGSGHSNVPIERGGPHGDQLLAFFAGR